MRQAWPVMGTVVSLDIPSGKAPIFDAVADLFKEIDQRFSPYKKPSEVSAYANGKLKLAKASREIRHVISQCRRYQEQTGGYFSVSYHGRFDPSGYVKGWAIAKAGELIEGSGYNTFCLGVGGDVLAKSRQAKRWRIGISDPKDTQKIVATLEIKNGAVATSGNYERGKHIYNPQTGKTADFWQSVTVIDPDIIKADVWATAAFAMAEAAPAELAKHELDFLLIDKAGHIIVSDRAKALAGYS